MQQKDEKNASRSALRARKQPLSTEKNYKDQMNYRPPLITVLQLMTIIAVVGILLTLIFR